LKKRSFIELTPLLDVVLILLFIFILNVNTTQENLYQAFSDIQQSKEDLVKELQIKNQQLDQITKALSSFLQLDRQQLLSLLEDASNSEKENFMKTLEPLLDDKQIVQELLYYQALQNFFNPIHIGLKGSDNRLWINDQSTTITISKNEIQTAENYEQKKKQIISCIEKEIPSSLEENNRILLYLSLLDSEVYQYAYKLTWDALTDIEKQYGPEHIFKAEQIYILDK